MEMKVCDNCSSRKLDKTNKKIRKKLSDGFKEYLTSRSESKLNSAVKDTFKSVLTANSGKNSLFLTTSLSTSKKAFEFVNQVNTNGLNQTLSIYFNPSNNQLSDLNKFVTEFLVPANIQTDLRIKLINIHLKVINHYFNQFPL